MKKMTLILFNEQRKKFFYSYFLVTYFNISSVDINQCANDGTPFGNTHKCPIGTEVSISFS